MEHRHQQWRRLLTTPTPPATTTSSHSFSFKHATVFLSILNLFIFLLLLRDISSSSSASSYQLNSAEHHVRESEQMRRAMKPLQLIKTIRVIELENEKLQTVIHEDSQKQTAALDLSNRLKDIHSSNDAASVKALEEWRKRKMERARKREMDRNGTLTI